MAVVGVSFYGALGSSTGSYANAFSASLVYLIAVGVTLALTVQLLPRGDR